MLSNPSQREGSIKTVKFNGRNFAIWKFSLFIRLREHDLVPIVDGTRPKPEVKEGSVVTNKALIDKWMKDDNLAMHYLFNTFLEEQQNSLLTCETARSIWVSIENQYQQNSIKRGQALHQQFLNVTYDTDHSVRAHIEKIKLLAKELTDAGCPSDEQSTINRILTTLPDPFLGFFTSWESTAASERNLANLTTRLCNEEERNKRRHSNAAVSKDSDNKAFFHQPSSQHSNSNISRVDHAPFNRELARFNSSPYPQRRGRGGRRFPRTNRGYNSRATRFCSSNQGNKRREGKCWYCDYPGHWEKECRFKMNDENTKAHAASFEETNDKTIHLDSSKPSVAFIAHTTQSSLPNNPTFNVYLYPGATKHMFHQQSMFSNLIPVPPGSKWIQGIGNSRVEILGTGDVVFNALVNGVSKPITFSNSFFAHKLGTNLISVGTITARGRMINFFGSRVYVNLHGVTVFTGERADATLYRLDKKYPKTNKDDLQSPYSFRALSRSIHDSIEEWHQRLAHLNYPMIIKMSQSGAVDGFNLPASIQPPIENCHDCAASKAKRTPFGNSTSIRSSRIGQLIFSDVWGPAQVKSIGGAIYCCTLRDDHSDFRAAYYIKTKAQVAESVKNFICLVHTQTGQLVACIRTDGGTEYESDDFEGWLRRKGIRHETTVRYSPQQNGSAKRDNRTLFEGTRTLLHSNKSLPLSLWAEATNHKFYVLNRSTSTTCPTTTPHEAWYKSKSNRSTLRTFGKEFYALIPKQIREGKLESVGKLVYFVGNSDTQKGERFYDPSTGKVNTSCDASPAHHVYTARLPSINLQNDTEIFPQIASRSSDHDLHLDQESLENQQDNTENTHLLVFPSNGQEDPVSSAPPAKTRRLARTRTSTEEEKLADASPIPDPHRSALTKTPKVIKSMNATNINLPSRTATPSTRPTEEEVPDQYQDAISCREAPEWIAATKREFDSLMKTKIYTVVDRPKDHSVIKTRWTFKIKPGFKGNQKIYKARFVAKGYTQEPDVDYKSSETYAPTRNSTLFEFYSP